MMYFFYTEDFFLDSPEIMQCLYKQEFKEIKEIVMEQNNKSNKNLEGGSRNYKRP